MDSLFCSTCLVDTSPIDFSFPTETDNIHITEPIVETDTMSNKPDNVETGSDKPNKIETENTDKETDTDILFKNNEQPNMIETDKPVLFETGSNTPDNIETENIDKESDTAIL